MELIEHLLMKLISFGGIGFLIHICSRNKYIFKYSSEKRKIEIYPNEDKSHNKTRWRGLTSLSFYKYILTHQKKYVKKER